MRKVLAVILFLALIVTNSYVGVAADNVVKIYIDGELQNYEQPPVIKDGTTLVPLRAIFESLGAEVGWDNVEKMVVANKGNITIKLKVNSKQAIRINNGVEEIVELAVPAQLINSNTMVPIRFVSESLGAIVKWDSATKSILIFSNEPNTIGNTTGNLYNMGIVAKQGNWIYTANASFDMKLYKVKEDGTELTKLSDDPVFMINVVGDWVYYSNLNDYNIYKVNVDGTGRTLVLDEEQGIARFDVVGDYIYYVINDFVDNNWQGIFYSVKVDGSEKTKLLSGKIYGFNFTEDYIYYNKLNTSNINEIHRMSLDGTNDTVIEKATSDYLILDGDYLYYIDYSNDYKIYKMKVDGSGKQKINNTPAQAINVQGDYVYYIDRNNNKVKKVKKDGSQTRILSDDSFNTINIAGDSLYLDEGYSFLGYLNSRIYKINSNGGLIEPVVYVNPENIIAKSPIHYPEVKEGQAILDEGWIYYINLADHHKLYKMTADGSQNIMLTKQPAENMIIDGDFIYYYLQNNGIIYRMDKDGENIVRVNHENLNIHSFTIEGDWIYLNSYVRDRIYRMKKDGSNLTLLAMAETTHFTIENDWVYFLDDKELYKVDINGIGYTKVLNDEVSSFVIKDDHIYYLKENQLYRSDLKGEEKALILRNVEYFDIVEDSIYYSYGYWNDSEKSGIYKADLNGQNSSFIFETQATGLNIVGDWIYYTMYTMDPVNYRVKIDGTQNEKLEYIEPHPVDSELEAITLDFSNNKNADDIELADEFRESAFYINVVGDWVYYTNTEDEWKLYKVKMDGTDTQVVSEDYSRDLMVAGDWIFYINGSDDFAIYRIKTDGSEKAKISQDDIYSFAIDGDWVYFTPDSSGGYGGYGIYRMKNNGQEIQLLTEQQVFDNLEVEDGWIYFEGMDGNYRVKIDGSVLENTEQ